MKKKQYSWLFCLLLSIMGCSSSDTIVEEAEQHSSLSEGAYTEECKWIYQQMNHYYLWRTEMPDSSSCDYATDPVTFFKSLLSKKDRFSYSARNESYQGPSEIIIDNGGDDLHASLLTDDNASSVIYDKVFTMGNHRIGYLCYKEFSNVKEVGFVMKTFMDESIDELVVDLRYNPGGYVSVCKYLCNCIINENGYGNVFQYKVYNDVVANELMQETGEEKEKDLYEFPPQDTDHILGTPIYPLKLQRVFVLTSKRTASASEALIVCLRPYMKVVVIGEQTVGKGVGSFTLRNSKCKYELHPITMRYYNSLMQSTPDDGIIPDSIVPDGYETSRQSIGNADEPLLKAALELIEN